MKKRDERGSRSIYVFCSIQVSYYLQWTIWHSHESAWWTRFVFRGELLNLNYNNVVDDVSSHSRKNTAQKMLANRSLSREPSTLHCSVGSLHICSDIVYMCTDCSSLCCVTSCSAYPIRGAYNLCVAKVVNMCVSSTFLPAINDMIRLCGDHVSHHQPFRL